MRDSKNTHHIWDFLEQESTLTLATSVNNQPYCANVIYVFNTEQYIITFKSDMDTRHAQEMLQQKKVGGNVLPQQKKFGTIKGLQLTGEIVTPSPTLAAQLQKEYYSAHPYAKVMSGDFWYMRINFAKLTDSTLGIGKRVEWTEES